MAAFDCPAKKPEMITRYHKDDSAASWASYSDCETYRYALCRVWDATAQRVTFVMLNPSKATEQANDPTIARCEARARALGFGALQVTNLFALRETDPHTMRKHPAPIGPDNDAVLIASADWANVTIAAWGVHGEHQARHTSVRRIFQDNGVDLHCLGLTKDGHPRHPLYLPYTMLPQAWPPA